jgi:signal transduction histidine kinase
MAQPVLADRRMEAPPDGTGAGGSGTRDLAAFNHWLCITRLRAASGVLLFAAVLHLLHIGRVDLVPVVWVCAGLLVVSAVGLLWPPLSRAPRVFFNAQSFADLAAITVGIGASVDGLVALVFRSIYVVAIVPASLISVRCGLGMAGAATVGHEILLGLERGFSLATLGSVESLVPAFCFFLVAQQGFFYGAHLEGKNTALAGLAARLAESRERLAAEGRMSAALLEVARTLSSTLDGPELLARMNRTAYAQLGADWSGTFLVDAANATFRVAAVSEADAASSEIGPIEFPMHGWSVVARLGSEPVVVLTGEDAERTPLLFASGRRLTTVLLAAFYHDRVLVGFLAVGYVALPASRLDRALHLLAGIAQNATIVLQNVRLLEEMRLASALKSEFVGAISHELRSPLNVMLGYLEMLLDRELGPLTTAQADALLRTQRHSLALLEMISALLDLNRLEAGRLPVDRAPVAVGALLEEIRHQLPEDWCRPEVELRLAVAPGLPVIETDARKLKTVIRNLVHNALKFTERGHVTLAATLTPDGELAITVTDTGSGIPPDAIDRIFDMFHQVPGAGGGGVGLGLHIVRRFIEVLGGRVSVESEVGVGTRFAITLPLTAGDGRDDVAAGAPAHAA